MKQEYQILIIISIILFILCDWWINNTFIDIALWVIAILLIYTSLRLNEETLAMNIKPKKKEKYKKDKKKK
jgi:4-hydroxybenzoate polyprenyltransferase